MVFFFANMWLDDYSRGITKKVYAQIHAMRELGYPVSYYTGYKKDKAVLCDGTDTEIAEKKFPTKNRWVHRMFRNYSLKTMTADFLKTVPENVKIAYLRYVYFDPKTIKMLKQVKDNGYFVMLEIHSYPVYFLRDYKLWPVFALDYLCRKKALSYVDRIIALTDKKNLFGKETINIENGIDLAAIRPQRKIVCPGTIRIISVSYEWAVHGYDRLIRGIAEYNKNDSKKYRIEAIFVGTVLRSTEKLIKKLKLQEYVTITGTKYGKELDEIYDHCDLGMGCVAIHRRRAQTVSTIKTKEYIAKGIPFFYAGKPLFDEQFFPYSLQLESKEEPLNMDRIVQFYEEMEQIPDKVDKMREWAKSYTWEKQMEKAFYAV